MSGRQEQKPAQTKIGREEGKKFGARNGVNAAITKKRKGKRGASSTKKGS